MTCSFSQIYHPPYVVFVIIINIKGCVYCSGVHCTRDCFGICGSFRDARQTRHLRRSTPGAPPAPRHPPRPSSRLTPRTPSRLTPRTPLWPDPLPRSLRLRSRTDPPLLPLSFDLPRSHPRPPHRPPSSARAANPRPAPRASPPEHHHYQVCESGPWEPTTHKTREACRFVVD